VRSITKVHVIEERYLVQKRRPRQSTHQLLSWVNVQKKAFKTQVGHWFVYSNGHPQCERPMQYHAQYLNALCFASDDFTRKGTAFGHHIQKERNGERMI
jgi:hypothetical protein